MQLFSTAKTGTPRTIEERANERGAALITVLLFSVLLLAAGGALIMATALSATNAYDATAETQAYHAAEAGMQATLAVLRGNVAPSPLFDTSSSSAAANKISFRKAVSLSSSNVSGDAATTANVARLSRWLTYDALTYSATGIAGRVELSSPYAAISGMAYDTNVTDPDNSASWTYSTLGAFGTTTPSSSTVSYQFTGSGGGRVTVYYDPQPSTVVSAGSTSLGTFRLSAINNTPSFSTDPNATFTITVRQKDASGATVDVPIKCTLSLLNSTTVRVTFPTLTDNTNYIQSVTYARTYDYKDVIQNGTVSLPVTITLPEPRRVLVKVTGYGPRGARKQMQMLVSRFAFDYTANAAITIRGADSGTQMTSFTVGSSAPYAYSGYDNSGGANLPAFVVTNSADSSLVNTTIAAASGTQVTGSPTAAQLVAPSGLPSFLQTAQNARDTLEGLRQEAKNTFPATVLLADRNTTNDRYFAAGETPSNFGTVDAPLFTFVDGDLALPPSGGAGLLVVTGILDMRGSADFKGLVLVLGAGQVIRNGGGSDATLGSMDVARFDATGDFLPPSFDSNGSGASKIVYDSKLVDKSLQMAGPRIIGVSEY